MATPRIITIGGTTLNLADIKCFKPIENQQNILIVQFKTRYDYIVNPETNQFEKQEYNETAALEFYSSSSLEAHQNEWIEAWKKYLNDHE